MAPALTAATWLRATAAATVHVPTRRLIVLHVVLDVLLLIVRGQEHALLAARAVLRGQEDPALGRASARAGEVTLGQLRRREQARLRGGASGGLRRGGRHPTLPEVPRPRGDDGLHKPRAERDQMPAEVAALGDVVGPIAQQEGAHDHAPVHAERRDLVAQRAVGEAPQRVRRRRLARVEDELPRLRDLVAVTLRGLLLALGGLLLARHTHHRVRLRRRRAAPALHERELRSRTRRLPLARGDERGLVVVSRHLCLQGRSTTPRALDDEYIRKAPRIHQIHFHRAA